MHALLEKFLKNKGINEVKNLTPEEKEVFDGYAKILSKKDVTISDIEEFCRNQVGLIEMKWRDYDIPAEKKAEFIPYHTVYKSLLAVIKSPQVAREQLERYLNEMLKWEKFYSTDNLEVLYQILTMKAQPPMEQLAYQPYLLGMSREYATH